MAKSRLINTRFWDDNYTANLDPIEKLLFLYLLTNTSTNICGVYEIPKNKIAVETGIDKEMVAKILGRFEGDEKIFYRDGWVVIKNFIRHQNITNSKVLKGIENELEKAPSDAIWLLGDTLKELGIQPNDDVSYMSHQAQSYSNSNSNSNSNTNVKKSEETSLVAEVIHLFTDVNPACKSYYNNKTQRKACENLLKEYGFERVKKVIENLPNTNQMEYVPTITTPHQLEQKWVQLGTALQKQDKDPIIL